LNEGFVDEAINLKDASLFMVSMHGNPDKLATSGHVVSKWNNAEIKNINNEHSHFETKVVEILSTTTSEIVKTKFKGLQISVRATLGMIKSYHGFANSNDAWGKFLNSIGLSILINFVKEKLSVIFNFVDVYDASSSVAEKLKKLAEYSTKLVTDMQNVIGDLTDRITEIAFNASGIGTLLNFYKHYAHAIKVLLATKQKLENSGY